MKPLDDIPFNRGWVDAYRRISEEDTAEEILALRLLNEHLSGETSDPVLHSICLLFRPTRFGPGHPRLGGEGSFLAGRRLRRRIAPSPPQPAHGRI